MQQTKKPRYSEFLDLEATVDSGSNSKEDNEEKEDDLDFIDDYNLDLEEYHPPNIPQVWDEREKDQEGSEDEGVSADDENGKDGSDKEGKRAWEDSDIDPVMVEIVESIRLSRAMSGTCWRIACKPGKEPTVGQNLMDRILGVFEDSLFVWSVPPFCRCGWAYIQIPEDTIPLFHHLLKNTPHVLRNREGVIVQSLTYEQWDEDLL
ncbi:hypothetical protein CVT24_002214, partial [Panaeolus cyanescens]